MKLDLSFLLDKENETTDVSVSCDVTSVSIGGTSYRKSSDEPFTLTFYNDEGKKLYVSGSTKVSFISPCDRCLEEVEIEIPVKISEEFFISNDIITCDEEEGVICIEENSLDVDCLVVNEILVNWPAKVLCKEDCKGICPVCGKNRNIEECDCDTSVMDPRMQQFQDVFKDFKEV
ncbi:MAG: DUF177 domain-containing protein [Lachnospiraceae bacterium]|nr:DUF177 domain-containing protein [Lachnospiraceae bacterium]